MSDKSLPKPVPPRDSLPKANSQPKPTLVQPAPTKSSPPKPASSSSVTKPMSGPPPRMKPPAGMIKPPALGAKPFSKPAAVGTKPAPIAKQATPDKSTPIIQNKDKTKPTFAKVKGSPFKYLPFIVGGLVLVGLVWFVISKFMGNKTVSTATDKTNQLPQTRKTVPAEQTSLIYWSLWEPDSSIKSILAKFEEANPGVKVSYIKQSHQDYRERLQTAIAAGNGPDVFRYHASWTPMLAQELAAMPQAIMSATEYQATFYPVAAKMLNIEGQIVGIPLMYDGLGLYYNQDMLTAANSEPPHTWAEVKVLANKLAIKEGGNLKRGGMAIGNASNVEHFADILGLLMLQNGADPADPSSKEAQDALAFYTNFVKEDEVWNDKLPSSTVAFARGDVAMMLAPSWRVHEIKAMNPELKFGIAPVPRLGDDRLAWASFWAEGVSDKSKHKTQAWELIKFLSSKEIQQELYSAQSQLRTFGEIYSRVDLANELAGDELVSPFLEDAPAAAGWQLSSYTHDNGVNDLLIKYYEDAINAVLGGETVEEALKTVAQGTKQVLRQYGVK